MKNENLFAVLMAGGVGSRFWPKSRRENPKQLLKIFSNEKLITETSNRLEPLISKNNHFIVTNILQKNGIVEALPGIPKSNIIIEPVGRNTAPCIGLAAIYIEQINPDGIMVVLPADHLIYNEERFREIINIAAEYALESSQLVTLGIKPNYPETGYGYIQSGDVIKKVDGIDIHSVKTFAEKPNLETARRFLQSGDFSWNSGMFIWSVKTILKEIEEYLPELYDGLMEIKKHIGSDKETATIEKIYKTIKKVSIDYGIMERSAKVATIAGDFGWNDIGSWDVVYDLFQNKDEDDNAALPPTRSIFIKSGSNLISSNDKKIVALVNVDNLIVIDTEDALLVCPRGESQDVKYIVEQLKKSHQEDFL